MPKSMRVVKPPINLSPEAGSWIWFPDALPGGRFRGFENREDVTQLRGAWPVGQNVKFRKSGLPTLREGTEAVGTDNVDTNSVKKAAVFETRGSDQFEVKALKDGTVKFWLWGESTDWLTLISGLTANVEWGMDVIDETSDATSHLYFGNGTDGFYQFNGAWGVVASKTGTTVTVEGAVNVADLGFYTASTRAITVAGTSYEYTGESTVTFTGITDTTGITVGDLVVQTPRAVSGLSTVKSSVFIAHDGRLHFRNDAKQNAWWYSKLDNPDDISSPGTGTDGYANTKAIEGGGGIRGFLRFNKAIIAGTRRSLKLLRFLASGDRIDVPFYENLVSTDNQGTTIGFESPKAVFSTPKGGVFITPDKRLMLLTALTSNEEPKPLILSDPIQPVFDRGDHRSAVGRCVNNVIFYAFKSTSSAENNDTLLVGDMSRVSFDREGNPLPIEWDEPCVGLNVNDITAIQTEDGETEIHLHSSVNSNTYKLLPDDKTDSGVGFTWTVRTWAETFDQPELLKVADMACIAVRMKETGTIICSFLYDENGVTGIYETTLLGSMTEHRYATQVFNPFGASPFGSMKFGSNPETDNLSLYVFFLEVADTINFRNVSLQLSGDVDGNDFEIVRIGYRLTEVVRDIPRSVMLEPA